MLLLDENLSPRLISRISLMFPDSRHVIHVGLDNSPDNALWCYAKENGLAIVSKDKDFLSMQERLGYPPKLIYLSMGNTRVSVVESILIENQQAIFDFLQKKGKGLLVL